LVPLTLTLSPRERGQIEYGLAFPLSLRDRSSTGPLFPLSLRERAGMRVRVR